MKLAWPLLVLATACGGGAKSAPPPATSTVASKASIDAFHEVLAPLWHSPDGAERTDKTCAAVPTLEARAQDVGDAPLVEAVQALAAECTGDRAAFKPKLAAVHDAFHAAMEKGGAAHEERHRE